MPGKMYKISYKVLNFYNENLLFYSSYGNVYVYTQKFSLSCKHTNFIKEYTVDLTRSPDFVLF